MDRIRPPKKKKPRRAKKRPTKLERALERYRARDERLRDFAERLTGADRYALLDILNDVNPYVPQTATLAAHLAGIDAALAIDDAADAQAVVDSFRFDPPIEVKAAPPYVRPWWRRFVEFVMDGPR